MNFFADQAAHGQPTPVSDASEFANALQNRQTFVVPAPSPRMVNAMNRSKSPNTSGISGGPITYRASASQAKVEQSSVYKPIDPAELPSLLHGPNIIVMDLRPHSQWQAGHIRGALSVTAPSTLLRRPNFSLDKLCALLPQASDRETFGKWRTAPAILVYDYDTVSLMEGSNVHSLLTKFYASGASASLCFLRGGVSAVGNAGYSDLIDVATEEVSQPPTSDNNYLSVQGLAKSAFQQGSTTGAAQRPNDSRVSGAPPPSTTRVTAANPFYENIRQHVELADGITERIPLYVPKKILRRASDLPFEWLRNIASWAGTAPFTAVENVSSREGRTSSSNGSAAKLSTTSSSRRQRTVRMEEGMESLAMQFYRIELGEQRRLQGIMDFHTQEFAQSQKQSAKRKFEPTGLPEDVYEVSPSVESIRSQLVFASDRHSITPPGEDMHDFPFSITAGLERGDKNRYRNIWPFDHARVRLRGSESDYINASYIQPRGTYRHYIATQGPMPATYNDFWTLVWEQRVCIIVMLTKTVESRQVKSGYYWKDGRYGALHLQLIKEEGGTDAERLEEALDGQQPTQGFDFGMSAETKARKARHAKADMARQLGAGVDTTAQGNSDSDSPSDDDDDSIIRREFLLWNDSDPSFKRTVVQFQYVGWPDASVPTSPSNLLKLISEVNVQYAEYRSTGVVGQDQKDEPGQNSTSRSRTAAHQLRRGPSLLETPSDRPVSEVLVHCSAGVGRTGSFILVDAILDAIRRKMHQVPNSASSSYKQEQDLEGQAELRSAIPDDALSAPAAGGFAIPFSKIKTEVEEKVYKADYPSRSVGSIPELEGLSMNSVLLSPSAPASLSRSVQPSMHLNVIPPLFQPNYTPLQTPAATVETHPTTSFFGSQLDSFPKREGDYFRNVSSRATQLTDSSQTSDVPSTKGSRPKNAPPPVFDFTAPRPISVPRHSRKRTLFRGSKSSAHGVPRSKLMDLDEVEEEGNIEHDVEGELCEDDEDQDGFTPPRDPSPLSGMDEPVREILEGIREQRMSMCQSLRQYVFVHRAIVEGAMQIVDEMEEDRVKAAEVQTEEVPMELSSPQRKSVPIVSDGGGPFGSTSSSFGVSHNLPLLDLSGQLQPPPIAGSKRLASPTELLRLDLQGEQTIHKRPSMSRMSSNSDSSVAALA